MLLYMTRTVCVLWHQLQLENSTNLRPQNIPYIAKNIQSSTSFHADVFNGQMQHYSYYNVVKFNTGFVQPNKLSRLYNMNNIASLDSIIQQTLTRFSDAILSKKNQSKALSRFVSPHGADGHTFHSPPTSCFPNRNRLTRSLFGRFLMVRPRAAKTEGI